MCAYNFAKNGINFILVDGGRLASGVSAGTTAQLSISHDEIYNNIIKKHGKNKALAYLKSQIKGLELIKDIIKNEDIDCDYKEESTFLGSNNNNNIKLLEEQYNLISAVYNNCIIHRNNIDIIDSRLSIEFLNQGIFNPVKYMMKIIDILVNHNISMYENTRVTKIDKKNNKYLVTVNNKYKISVDKIIMACHYPILNPDNLYFAKIYQSSSYAVAFRSKIKLEANYVSLDEPYYYLRTYDRDTLIIGGSDHFTGVDIDINECYKKLTDKIFALDSDAEIVCKWFTEDCMPIDSLPFIGQYSRKNSNIILITGFQKWGFTNSHIAAKNVTDMILGNDYDRLYKTNRWSLIKDFKGTARMIFHSINGLLLSKMFIKSYNLDEVQIGSGIVTKINNKNVLVYRANENEYIILKNKCTHMGCSLIWNDVDKVWESKCHGSIFDRYGHIIYGPALKDLEQINL
jgi:glycine/D-amino acid oxidase-like deaminating enzyme/nitrite reductase/ring-hydroxylating ferredoxin subunit